MEIVKYDDSQNSDHELITDILSFDNKDLLLVALLEKLCQIGDNKIELFKKICNYLYKIGILDDPKTFANEQKTVRELYINYLSQIISKFGNNKSVKSLQHSNNSSHNLQIANLQYSNNFIELGRIGKGGFGEVFKVYNRIDTQQYAIKKVPFFDIDEPNNVRAFNEVRCLAKLNHPNVVRYNTAWLELSDKKTEVIYDDNIVLYPVLFIQMELCNCSIKKYLMKRNYSGRQSDMHYEFEWIKELADGLEYIHKNNILHRDLNLNNIFLDSDMKPKIGDFGMAITVNSRDVITCMSPEYGVEMYMPPEYNSEGIYVEKSDIYSMGIIFFEILYVFSTEMARITIINNIKKNVYPPQFIAQYPIYYDIICGMLCNNFNDRYTMETIIKKLKNITY